jgi:hypothetical protein
MTVLIVVGAAIGLLQLRRRRRAHRPRLLEIESRVAVPEPVVEAQRPVRGFGTIYAVRDDLRRQNAELRRALEAECECAAVRRRSCAGSSKMMIAVIAAVVARAATADAEPPTAEDLYAEGQTAYDHADYATAVAQWQAAYDLSGEPELLFDVAQARRLSGDCPRALATYRRFVEVDPTSAQHALAISLGREMAKQCGRPAPVQAPVPEIPLKQTHGLDQIHGLVVVDERRSDEDPGRALKIAGLATGATGALAIIAGLGIGHHGHAIGDEVAGACRAGCDWAAWQGKDAAGRRDVSIGLGVDVLGAAAVVAGAGLYYFGIRAGSVSVVPSPREGGGATISWSGSW